MRLIDADALHKFVEDEFKGGVPYEWAWALTVVDTAPAIDAAPVVHGRWEWFEEWLPSTPDHPAECSDCGWMCSCCKTALEDVVGGYWDDPCEKPMMNYCPNCGTRMDGEL